MLTMTAKLITNTSKNALQIMQNLDHIFYICYPILIFKNLGKVVLIALIKFKSDENTINSTYVVKLDFRVQKTDISVSNINSFFLEIFDMFIAFFKVLDKLGYLFFFQTCFYLRILIWKLILIYFF